MKPPKDFGRRIRAARAYADVSQEDLADALGVRRGTLGNWETGDVELRGAKLKGALVVLEEETGIDADWFLSPTLGPLRLTTPGEGEAAPDSEAEAEGYLEDPEQDDEAPGGQQTG